MKFATAPLIVLFACQFLATTVNGLEHWLYSSKVDDTALTILNRADLVGIQALYSWKSLEPDKGKYNFSTIKRDIVLAKSKGKKFWVQLQDRTFSPKNDPVPQYMHTPEYNNGSAPTCDGEDCETNFKVDGWMAQQWNPRVRERFQALLRNMAQQLDGEIMGINLAETSISVDQKANGYSHEEYMQGELDNAGFAAGVFKKTVVVQYVNFWPGDWGNEKGSFNNSFDFYAARRIGVGGPDLVPFSRGQEANSYPFIKQYHDKVPISVVAVQEPDLEKISPNTKKPFTKEEFVNYATNKLGVRIIFWATASPWLKEIAQQPGSACSTASVY